MKDLLRDNGHVMLMRLFGHCKWACTCGRTSTTRRVSLRATSQPSGLTEQARVTRVRVERQTHLPASREEAWAALKQLVPREEWEELSAVFVALETIHRAEQQVAGEEALRCLRLANEALEPIVPDPPQQPNRKAKRKMKNGNASPPMPSAPLEVKPLGESHSDLQEAWDNGSNGFPDAMSLSNSLKDAEGKYAAMAESSSRAISEQPSENGSRPDGDLKTAPRSEHGSSRGAESSDGVELGTPSSSSQKRSSKSGQKGAGQVALQVLHDVAAAVQPEQSSNGAAEDGPTRLRKPQPEPSAVPLRVAVCHKDRTEASQEDEEEGLPEVVSPKKGLQVESASRLEYDRSKWLRLPTEGGVDPEKADAHFMRCLLELLRKAHFAQLNDRDEAMSRSLNSDYLDQLLIRADTSRLDGRLVAHAAADRPVPEEEHAILVFKRGYGQATRRGRMLVAKLDFLQLLVIKGSLAYLAKQTSRAWRAIKHSVDASTPDEARTVFDSREEQMEETAWERVQEAWSAAGRKLSDWGVVSPRLMLAGGGLFLTLSNWGLLPSVDVLPIERFNAVWRPSEPERLRPVYVERVTIREALRGDLWRSLFGPIELVEPTFGELLVLYRRKTGRNALAELKERIMGGDGAQRRLLRREPVTLRVLRDIPVPSWKLVFPDKLLQFRPLDGLRADLLTVAGLLAFIAQAKYDSFILEVITTISALTLLVRVILGYNRMAQRYEKLENKLLAESTVAGQDACLQYLAACAALQQWEQSALAYLLLHSSPGPLSADSLSAVVESLLEGNFSVRIRFNAAEALGELQRLHLVEMAKGEQGSGGAESAAFSPVAPKQALQQLRTHWNTFLDDCLERRLKIDL